VVGVVGLLDPPTNSKRDLPAIELLETLLPSLASQRMGLLV
jgi:hypothetical protein